MLQWRIFKSNEQFYTFFTYIFTIKNSLTIFSGLDNYKNSDLTKINLLGPL